MGLAKAYLTERMNPVPVATRLPQPANTADTVNGFIRIEPDGGAVMLDDLLFNCGIIVHSYAPHNQDSQAEINLMHCLAHLGAAQGRYIVHPSLQRPWFCTYSRITSLAISQPDPAVNLTRLRGAATWRIKGTSDPLNETSPVE